MIILGYIQDLKWAIPRIMDEKLSLTKSKQIQEPKIVEEDEGDAKIEESLDKSLTLSSLMGMLDHAIDIKVKETQTDFGQLILQNIEELKNKMEDFSRVLGQLEHGAGSRDKEVAGLRSDLSDLKKRFGRVYGKRM